jgi:hypothetical protein
MAQAPTCDVILRALVALVNDTGNKGSKFSHYTGIDDLIEQGRLECDPEKRAKRAPN